MVASRLFPVLRRRWIIAGLTYGAVIFLVMDDVVVPLSAWSTWAHFSSAEFAANLLAMLLFGLIVAFFGRQSSH